MVHTLPPWTSKWRMAKIFGQIDSGELATRLGSIDTFDRRGNIVWMDDFEASTLKWNSLTIGANGSGVLSTETARNGASCFKMVTDAVTGRGWQIVKRLPIPESGRIGIEFSVSSADDKWNLALTLALYTLAGTINANLTWNEEFHKLWIIPLEGGSEDFFFDAYHFNDIYNFYTMKLVVDFSTSKFVRAIWNDYARDLSGYALRPTAFVDSYFMSININVTAKENAAKTVYIDDVIVTQNEP